MIEMQYNFPLLSGQGAQWRERLAQAVAQLSSDDPNDLRPTFRADGSAQRAVAAAWLGVPAERTWITCGGHHGSLIALLAAGLAGKAIAVDAITYTGIIAQARMLASPLLACGFDDQGMLPEDLRELCEEQGTVAAIYTMPTVHNPLGCVASLLRRQAIVEVARAFNLIIIEDDAYGYMEPTAPPNYAALAPERTFYVRGLSKSYAPATRTGFLVAPEAYTAAIEVAIKNSTTGTSLPHNMAALSLIADGSLDAVIARKVEEGAQRNAAARALLGDSAAPGARSAWHLWVTLPEGVTPQAFEQTMLERDVLVSGGHGFAVPPAEANGVRLALGGEIDPARTLEGVALVAAALRENS
jgi:DNA-binding transcriptional MocR family regulator